MTQEHGGAAAPVWGASADVARTTLTVLRDQLLTYGSAPADDQATLNAATGPLQAPLSDELPDELARLVAEYEQGHPGERLTPVRLLSVGHTDALEPAAFTAADLPAGDDLVLLSVTQTIAAAHLIEVRSRVLIARRSTVG